jgi:hypothetical protein
MECRPPWDAWSVTRAPTEKQHLVSRVLLSRWAVQNKLIAFNLQLDRPRRRAPSAEGFQKWFVQEHESSRMETLWAKVEARLPAVFRAVDNETALDDPGYVRTLKDLLALHAIRALYVSQMWADAMVGSEHAAAVLELANDPGLLAGHFHERTGLEAAGPGAILEERNRILRDVVRRLGVGGTAFAESLEEQLEKLKAWLEPRNLEIGVAQQGAFIIADSPAVTADSVTGRVGFRAGATIGASDAFVLPLDPRHVLAAGGGGRFIPVSGDGVDQLNVVQVKAAQAKVYFREDAGTLSWVRAIRGQILSASSSGASDA